MDLAHRADAPPTPALTSFAHASGSLGLGEAHQRLDRARHRVGKRSACAWPCQGRWQLFQTLACDLLLDAHELVEDLVDQAHGRVDVPGLAIAHQAAQVGELVFDGFLLGADRVHACGRRGGVDHGRGLAAEQAAGGAGGGFLWPCGWLYPGGLGRVGAHVRRALRRVSATVTTSRLSGESAWASTWAVLHGGAHAVDA